MPTDLLHLFHDTLTLTISDHWSAGQGPLWVQPFFWCTQTLHYYYRYFATIFTRPKDEALEALGVTTLVLFVVGYLLAEGWSSQLFIFVALPRIITDTCLAYSFDFAPHHPHDVPRHDNIYECTAMIGGLVAPSDGVDLTLPLIYQNYHNIHHLYPTVPFYKYPVLWNNHRKELLELGTPVGSWFGPLVTIYRRAEGKKGGLCRGKASQEPQVNVSFESPLKSDREANLCRKAQ